MCALRPRPNIESSRCALSSKHMRAVFKWPSPDSATLDRDVSLSLKDWVGAYPTKVDASVAAADVAKEFLAVASEDV